MSRRHPGEGHLFDVVMTGGLWLFATVAVGLTRMAGRVAIAAMSALRTEGEQPWMS